MSHWKPINAANQLFKDHLFFIRLTIKGIRAQENKLNVIKIGNEGSFWIFLL